MIDPSTGGWQGEVDGIYWRPSAPVTDLDKCFFYHTMDLKSGETVYGNWDLRGAADEYLGHVDFQGKRALDVGTASGFLTFEMEDRGAEVISLDRAPGVQRDLVPHASYDYLLYSHQAAQHRSELQAQDRENVGEDDKDLRRHRIEREEADRVAEEMSKLTIAERLERRAHHESMRELKLAAPQGMPRSKQASGYWYAHAANQSKAKAYYGTVYEIPEAMGTVDIALYGSILLHLRDPFGALHSGLRLTAETAIVTDMATGTHRGKPDAPPIARFLPDGPSRSKTGTWWRLSPTWVQRAFEILGFEDTTVTFHDQKARGQTLSMFTVVGHRTAGAPLG